MLKVSHIKLPSSCYHKAKLCNCTLSLLVSQHIVKGWSTTTEQEGKLVMPSKNQWRLCSFGFPLEFSHLYMSLNFQLGNQIYGKRLFCYSFLVYHNYPASFLLSHIILKKNLFKHIQIKSSLIKIFIMSDEKWRNWILC